MANVHTLTGALDIVDTCICKERRNHCKVALLP